MAEMTDMRKDVDWYYANLDSLFPIYNGKYLAIANGQLLGDFDECIPLEQERHEWYDRSNRAHFGESVK